jgi:D-alanyl-D-alanine carboxypeptidase (penicillin-binding protein 5/6)
LRRLLLALLLVAASLPACAFETTARAAYVIDGTTGAVLLAHNETLEQPPASMSKLMTLTLLFEALADGRLTLDSTFRVSEKAWRMQGSKMFLDLGSEVRVEDLIRGIIVQSGNDACVVVAEALANDEDAFARRMTERGREIGLENSVFLNSTGWPAAGEHMIAKDLVTLARHIIEEFPQFYPYFAETEFTWNGILQQNRNPLLTLGIGADGLKTGHTEDAGYGLVGSAVQDGRRIIFAVMGLDSMRAREEETERLTKWAFREFRNRSLFAKGAVIGEAEVWLGAERRVPLVAARDVAVTLPATGSAAPVLRIAYRGPVPAPVAEGQEIARLTIAAPGLAPVEVPLLAGRSVPVGGYLVKLRGAAEYVIDRALGAP